MSANSSHRRHVPARVIAVQELRQSGAAGTHTDRRRKVSREACRGNELRRALAEQGHR